MNAQTDNVMQLPTTLDDLVHQYVNAKVAEDGAKKIRLDLETRICALAPPREEGSTTTTLDNGFKLTTTGKLNYKCDDLHAMLEALAQWPEPLKPVKTSTVLDETGCKYLRQHEPEMWNALARYITVTPAKTAVKVGV